MSDIEVTRMGGTSYLDWKGVPIGYVYPWGRIWRAFDTSHSQHKMLGGLGGFKYKKEAIDAVVKSAQQVDEELK